MLNPTVTREFGADRMFVYVKHSSHSGGFKVDLHRAPFGVFSVINKEHTLYFCPDIQYKVTEKTQDRFNPLWNIQTKWNGSNKIQIKST